MVHLFQQVQICHELWEEKEKSNTSNERVLTDNKVDNTKCNTVSGQVDEDQNVLEGQENGSDEDEDPFGTNKNAVSV